MKKTIQLMTCAAVAAMSMETAIAALNIPSDGSDGVLVITNNTVIDLSQAVTGNWNANNSANAGRGIYDSNKWAVVFKYSSVTIQSGATVTFANHASRAPVVWLVQSNVTINGTLSVDGQATVSPPGLAEPGPGGFRGGAGYYVAGVIDGAGFGPGGGTTGKPIPSNGNAWWGAGGSYASVGSYGATTYGNPSLIPLLGGSGAGGSNFNAQTGGGAGGGAILVACSDAITIGGTIRANGGAGGGAGGSGGGIRLISDTLKGNGIVQAIGGATGGNPGGVGRIRIERAINMNSLQINPDPSVVTLASGTLPLLWMPSNGPTVRVISISGNTAPSDPRAGFGSIGADVVLPRVSAVTVLLETSNVETNTPGTTITVRATPRSNGTFTQATASVTQVISEDPLVARWTANVPVQDGYSAIQVRVVRP